MRDIALLIGLLERKEGEIIAKLHQYAS